MKKIPPRRLSLISAVVLLLLLVVSHYFVRLPRQTELSHGASEVVSAWQQQQSNIFIEGKGEVIKLLPDDRKGARHQRFILRTGPDHTLLVSHNIDLAPRINGLQQGDTVRFRGEYVYNNQGGLIHWTHHDPKGRHGGGWLEHRGRRYR